MTVKTSEVKWRDLHKMEPVEEWETLVPVRYRDLCAQDSSHESLQHFKKEWY